ncbi:MAG TPA: hypothetical protein PLK37_16145 [Terricaulis sp.]|nr:hypothetical protein [Terricaulis sp.]
MSANTSRRAARKARALGAEALLARAAAQLAAGDPLAAQRAVRAAAEIAALDARLKHRAAQEAEAHARHAETTRALEAREAALNARLAEIESREMTLLEEFKALEDNRASLEALYALMYSKPAAPDED